MYRTLGAALLECLNFHSIEIPYRRATRKVHPVQGYEDIRPIYGAPVGQIDRHRKRRWVLSKWLNNIDFTPHRSTALDSLPVERPLTRLYPNEELLFSATISE